MALRTIQFTPHNQRPGGGMANAADAAGRVACIADRWCDNVRRETALSGDRVSAVRQFLNSKKGRAAGIGISVLGVVAVAWTAWSSLGPSSIAKASRERLFIDATTGKPFPYTLTAGASIPVKAPSGGDTGYPAEECYWTADGTPKAEPTYVLLNSHLGKSDPTFCPDCGRLVLPRNPMAKAGAKPPPTKAEYKPRRK